jgi:hypothetical protein
MSALTDALEAAQRRAVTSLAKQYVGGAIEDAEVRQALEEIGLTDPTDTDRWLSCLDILKATGAELPRENGGKSKTTDEPASDAQWTLIRRLADDKQLAAPEPPLTKLQAHEVIDSLKANSYDPSKWNPGF